jgi:thiamine-phosphate pyrophosphorylase
MIIRGLYVITDPELTPDAGLLESVGAAVRGGAGIVQYRDKRRADTGYVQHARQLRELTRRLGALLIINDDVELARSVDADGVHVGRDDVDLATARRVMGNRLIGVSCYNDIRLAHAAELGGADYVAFGSLFPSAVKPGAVHAKANLLRQARGVLSLPIVAIGGINVDNGGSLLAAGADALAVNSGVFGQADIGGAARRLSALFD